MLIAARPLSPFAHLVARLASLWAWLAEPVSPADAEPMTDEELREWREWDARQW